MSLLSASLVAVMEGNHEDDDVEQHQPMLSFKLFSDDDELERPLEVGASRGRKKGRSGTRFVDLEGAVKVEDEDKLMCIDIHTVSKRSMFHHKHLC